MDKSNSTDESQHQGDEHSPTGEPPHEAPAPITIDTADPVIDKVVEHPSDRKLHPDATISVETSPGERVGPARRHRSPDGLR